MTQRPFLHVERLGMSYPAPRPRGERLVIFEELTFGLQKGEFVSVIGHSGCGKSTLLGIIAGLTQATAGYVFVAGREVTRPGLARGSGECRTTGCSTPLSPGLGWWIPAGLRHAFRTAQSPLDVFAWHPDSDFGPTDADHPMINRTLLSGG